MDHYKDVCWDCKYLVEVPEQNGWHCMKIDHVIENSFAMAWHSSRSDCYDKEGNLREDQKKPHEN